MHIKLAESVRSSSAVSLGTTSSDPQGDDDLQKVIGYLRRSKEIVSSYLLALLEHVYFLIKYLINASFSRQKQRSLC